MSDDNDGPIGNEWVFRSNQKKKTMNILSLDGGGVKGIIEARSLDLILKTTTLFLTAPHKIRGFLEGTSDEYHFLEEEEERGKFLQLLDTVENPIQPAFAFDAIVGTSTGGLIAFALGGVLKDDEKVAPMTVAEVMVMYQEVSRAIFSKRAFGRWDIDERILSTLVPDLMKFYSQGPLREELEKYYGEMRLKDLDSECVIGCVAKRLEDETCPEASVLFSTLSIEHMEAKIVDVLCATSDAPVYFECPVQINGKNYVDGGMGANCPLGQALQAIHETAGRDINVIALSLAPPKQKPVTLDTDGRKQLIQWLNYFPNNLTDGQSIFDECKRYREHHQGVHHIRRLAPNTTELRTFKMDEAEKVGDMLTATDDFVTQGTSLDRGDVGALSVVSHAITQLAAFLLRGDKKRRVMAKRLETTPIKTNGDMYAALVPVCLAVANKLHEYDSDSTCARETLEAGVQILELFEAELKQRPIPDRMYLEEARMYRKLGTSYRNSGRLGPARLCHQKAVACVERYGPDKDSQEYVKCLVEAGETVMYLGCCTRNYLKEAQERIESEGSRFMETRINLKLAESLRIDGRLTDSLNLLKKAQMDGLGGNDLRAVGRNMANLVRSMDNVEMDNIVLNVLSEYDNSHHCEFLGLVHLNEGKFDNCRDDMEKALRTRTNAPSYEIARLQNILAVAYSKIGRVSLACTTFRKALWRMDKADGLLDGHVAFDSPITAAARNGLGTTSLDTHEYDQAMKEFKKSLEILERIHGKGAFHPDIHDVQCNAAICQFHLTNYLEADNLFTKAVDSWKPEGDDDDDEDRRSTVVLNHRVFQRIFQNILSRYRANCEADSKEPNDEGLRQFMEAEGIATILEHPSFQHALFFH